MDSDDVRWSTVRWSSPSLGMTLPQSWGQGAPFSAAFPQHASVTLQLSLEDQLLKEHCFSFDASALPTNIEPSPALACELLYSVKVTTYL